MPETAMAFSPGWRALERYSTRQLAPAPGATAAPVSLRAQIRSPCTAPGSGAGGV